MVGAKLLDGAGVGAWVVFTMISEVLVGGTAVGEMLLGLKVGGCVRSVKLEVTFRKSSSTAEPAGDIVKLDDGGMVGNVAFSCDTLIRNSSTRISQQSGDVYGEYIPFPHIPLCIFVDELREKGGDR